MVIFLFIIIFNLNLRIRPVSFVLGHLSEHVGFDLVIFLNLSFYYNFPHFPGLNLSLTQIKVYRHLLVALYVL